jgi:serine/threonine-protein kinase RsbT
MGFSTLDQTRIITAVSELARNIVVHAKSGKVLAFRVESAGKNGIKVVFEDKGQGIADIGKAMTDGFSSANSLGIGLKGARRLMDEFDLKSAPGLGTTVVVTKWK